MTDLHVDDNVAGWLSQIAAVAGSVLFGVWSITTGFALRRLGFHNKRLNDFEKRCSACASALRTEWAVDIQESDDRMTAQLHAINTPILARLDRQDARMDQAFAQIQSLLLELLHKEKAQ